MLMKRSVPVAVLFVIAAAAGVPVAAGLASMTAAPTPNLIRNGGAELGPAVVTSSGVVATIPGWTRTGGFTVVKYGTTGGFPDASVGTAIHGGKNFFAGGPANPKSGATQSVSVARYAARIDTGSLSATLSGDLGGYDGQNDSLTVVATFLSASGTSLGTVHIGPVSAAQRKSTTNLLPRTATAKVPAKTRSVSVAVRAVRTDGSYNDGYADNLSLTLG